MQKHSLTHRSTSLNFQVDSKRMSIDLSVKGTFLKLLSRISKFSSDTSQASEEEAQTYPSQ